MNTEHEGMSIDEIIALAREWVDRHTNQLINNEITFTEFRGKLRRFEIRFLLTEEAAIQEHLKIGEFQAIRKIVDDVFRVEYGLNTDNPSSEV